MIIMRRSQIMGSVMVIGAALTLLGSCSSSSSGDGPESQNDSESIEATVDETRESAVSETDTTSEVTQSTTELNLAGGNDPEDFLMPNVICMNLQEAQNEIQDHGVFYSRSQDLSGENRSQIIDSNWIVLEQTPAPGTKIGEGDAVLGVVKIGEPTNGIC